MLKCILDCLGCWLHRWHASMLEGHKGFAPVEAVFFTILHAAACLLVTTLAWLRAASTSERHP